MKQPYTKIELITPKMAEELLRKNDNRVPQKHIVRDYTILMKEGKFNGLNGETIKISKKGYVLDGQHRLLAIIESGKSLKTMVVYGLEEICFETIDVGQRRTGADTIYKSGLIDRNGGSSKMKSKIIATAITTGIRYEREFRRSKIHNYEVLDVFKDNRDMMDSVDYIYSLKRVGKLLPYGGSAYLHWMMSDKDQKLADNFWKKFFTGENLEKDSPILVLRSILIEDLTRATKFHSDIKLLMVIKTWNIMRSGKKIVKQKTRILQDCVESIKIK